MKIRISLAILIASCLSCQSDNRETAEMTEPFFERIVNKRFSVQNGNLDSLSLSTVITDDYDSSGLQTKSVYTTASGEIQMKFQNEYSNGLKTRVDWINSRDTLVRYAEMKYDENDRLIRSEAYRPNGEFASGFIHQWSEDGKVENKGPIEEGKPFKRNAIYFYNDQQEKIELHEFDENDSLYFIANWKYIAFDSLENWTERQRIVRDTVTRIEKRTIKYREDE